MHSNESIKEYYLRVWESIFGEFLGWSEEEVLNWAKQRDWLRCLDDEHDLLYHVDPQYWVVHSLLPNHLKETLQGLPLVRAHQKLVAALDGNIPYLNWPELPDWPRLRKNIEQVIAEYEQDSHRID